MRQKIYLVDATAEKGHVLFVKRLIRILEISYEIEFISSKKFSDAIGITSTMTINENLFLRPTRYHFVINQILILLKTLRHVKKDRPIIFTGFENISFSICSRFFKNKKVFAYIHNNLDKKGLSNMLLKHTSSKTHFIVLEEYLKTYFSKLVNSRVDHIPHPLNIEPGTPTGKRDYIFAINIDLSERLIRKEITDLSENLNLKVFVKLHANSDFNGSLEGTEVKRFYPDYFEKLAHAALVVLQVPYDYRVSGVFYECAILEKPVVFIGAKGLFAKKMIEKYQFVGDDLSIVESFRLGANAQFLRLHSDEVILEYWKKLL